MSLKARIQEDVKAAMRAQDKRRLGALRLVSAAIKQREVDERIELDDSQVVAVLRKMLKQRQDSLTQFRAGGRDDLADQEAFEIALIEGFLPQALGVEEVDALVARCVAEVGATSARDMGKVMARMKELVEGRADMGVVSARVKERLARLG
jgi:uncharacterized protein YqeY